MSSFGPCIANEPESQAGAGSAKRSLLDSGDLQQSRTALPSPIDRHRARSAAGVEINRLRVRRPHSSSPSANLRAITPFNSLSHGIPSSGERKDRFSIPARRCEPPDAIHFAIGRSARCNVRCWRGRGSDRLCIRNLTASPTTLWFVAKCRHGSVFVVLVRNLSVGERRNSSGPPRAKLDSRVIALGQMRDAESFVAWTAEKRDGCARSVSRSQCR